MNSPAVVAGSGKILGGRWFGRTWCRFVCVASPMLVEDVAFPVFLSHLGSGAAATLLGRQRSGQASFKARYIRQKALVYAALLISSSCKVR